MRFGLFLISLIFLQIFTSYPLPSARAANTPDVFVGLDMAYGDSVAEAKRLIDETSPYTNLFVIGCKGITYNTTRLNETCQYIVDKGLNLIVYRDTPLRNVSWAEMARQTWGDRFLGYYAYDEIGGWQIDMQEWRMVLTARNYSDAAYSYVRMAKWYIDRYTVWRNTTTFNLYTSDYALYSFDYDAGYDTVFTEFGWNISRQLNIALCRGAANTHEKDWGAILTWTYRQPPYLESGKELYNDMVLAYRNGAKYIILFDANKGWTQSVLKQEHLDALKQFWEYTKENPRQSTQADDRVAYVLPKDFGYGFRGPNDKIWGLWKADDPTSIICTDLGNLFTQYGERLDIIYDNGLLSENTYGYSKLIYANESSFTQPSSPTSSPATSLIPTQITTSNPTGNPPSPMAYVPLMATGTLAAVVVLSAYFVRKRKSAKNHTIS
jgi:hypothetical protein